MALYDAETEQKMRQTLKQVNRGMVLMWRLGLGGWLNLAPRVGGRIMVIVHTGRKSHKRHYNNVNYAIVNGEIFCTAGFGPVTDWYRNILNNPNVEVWMPDGWWNGIAEDASYIGNRLDILRQILINSGVAANMVGIDPKNLSDEYLAEITRDYRLLRIRQTAARTGPGGPGNLAWVWPLFTLFLLGRMLFSPRHSKRK
ncbi:MAG: nitroreductase family deazaflavin-dependent oxidoreductase [Anaerolineaceae bacterium]|nr:nitroreductase family deazaflavin-dependent oxidoreductase [Anaerolineaceae bacterium]